ncbi:MAG: hypothetical protein M0R69_00215 [Candidatus Cloacimonetes bacterium]|nr:hypothetical protein [Candidatus Cloacimonadota bacterium]
MNPGHKAKPSLDHYTQIGAFTQSPYDHHAKTWAFTQSPYSDNEAGHNDQ